MEKRKGIIVDVYRDTSGYDCTNGGISATQSKFVLIDESIKGSHSVDEDEVYLKLVKRFISGRDYFHVEPVFPPGYGPKGVGPMFGGNFAHGSRSSFPNDYPLPIHDRWESQAQYDTLSR